MTTQHQEITSREHYDKALATKDKYVLIYAYEGEVHAKAEERAAQNKGNADIYKVDVGTNELAKKNLKVSKTPAVIIYYNGEEVKRVEPIDGPAAAEEVSKFFQENKK